MNTLSELLLEQKKKTESIARKAIIELLKKVPDNTISLIDNPAWALVEGYERWFEDAVQGIRLRDGIIEYTMEITLEDNGERIPLFDECYTRNEYDNYSSLNWLSVLSAVEIADIPATILVDYPFCIPAGQKIILKALSTGQETTVFFAGYANSCLPRTLTQPLYDFMPKFTLPTKDGRVSGRIWNVLAKSSLENFTFRILNEQI